MRSRCSDSPPPGNLAFTRSLGCYGDVIPYDEVPAGLPGGPAVYVDISGDGALRAAIHEHLADALTYSCAVGATHWDRMGTGGGDSLPGPQPVLFFAPAQAAKRATDWGPRLLQDRIATAWAQFMKTVSDADNPWLHIVHGRGTGAVESCYTALLDGTLPPQEGHILRV